MGEYPGTPGTTVLIVDDHAGFRAMARAVLEADGFRVIAEADDGASAIEAALATHPEVMLIDVQLPDLDGFDVIGRLRRAEGRLPCIVLVSSREASVYGPRITESGAAGFVHKPELSAAALRALMTGPS